ncbi:ATP synthase F0 subcomplex B subunit [Limimaricola soesokkakensis]|uniref:ATP synthase subunit b n=1 Tax=Limimaricola soesokkakensis TaxID=1343159 RepID=A0A1X6ZIZ7_9RHOB|nr:MULTISPECIES: F0F1 ATP synthase subunit B [Limimaricola]MCZ4262651.1 F0F1 ATP synthase subunit B [Limimaricola sp. G21655-S1]PSK84868.1 ATP synthase F0 subcomplex B subunit [Limimaricola soesokkakensis]SLN52606.1 ATP synthase subunit b precursor [Limimaricola soesokkakensis]
MKLVLATLALSLTAAPAMAATGPFFSLRNTDFIVLLAFLLFVGVLLYFRVPREVGKLLDKRADGIRAELDEARGLREEAQSLLASYERKQKDVQTQADRIVSNAREEANRSAEQAKVDIAKSIQRRLTAAEEQIQSAQDKAVKEVRDQAVAVAVAAARQVIAEQMTAQRADKMIDESIQTVGAKLH